jgi:hypothetical protein
MILVLRTRCFMHHCRVPMLHTPHLHDAAPCTCSCDSYTPQSVCLVASSSCKVLCVSIPSQRLTNGEYVAGKYGSIFVRTVFEGGR